MGFQGEDTARMLQPPTAEIVDCPEPTSELLFGTAGLVLLALRISRARR